LLESIEPLKDKEVFIVGQLESGDIARAIVATQPDLKRKSLSIANVVLSRLSDAGYGPKSTEVQAPQEIVVKQEATIEQMSLRQLIELALEDSDRKPEAWRRIANHPDVLKVNQQ